MTKNHENPTGGRSRLRALVMPPDADGEALARPTSYEECRGGYRPCPIVSCPNNNYLRVSGTRVILNHGELEPWQIPPEKSCAGDMTEGARTESLVSRMAVHGVHVDGRAESRQGEMTLDEIGQSQGVSRERIRQIESAALRKLKVRMIEAGWSSEDIAEHFASLLGDGEGNLP